MKKKMWHCKSCGRVCDGSNTVCPDCGLDLGFYGEIQFVETGEPEPSSSSGFQTQEQAKPAAEEGSRPEIKEGHQDKESRPKKRGKRGKALILTGVALLLGCVAFMGWRRVEAVRLENLNLLDNLESGQTEYLLVTVDYTGFWGPYPDLEVSSSNNKVVRITSVEDDQIWMAFGEPGTARITVKAGEKSDSRQIPVCQITGVELDVPERPNPAEGIVLGFEDSVGYTAAVQYTGELNDENWLPTVEVTSSDTDIVEVDSESGRLIAKGYGTAVVIASVRDYEVLIPVYVFDITSVELQCRDLLVDGDGKTMSWIPEGLTMKLGLSYTYRGSNLLDIPFTFESSNEEVISVDPENHTITAVGSGEATITARIGAFSDSKTLEVCPVDRSTGSKVEGSIQAIAKPAEDSQSTADYTITVHFGDGIQYLTVPSYFGAGGNISYTADWEAVEEDKSVQAREGAITLQGSKWEQRRSIAGITFLFKRASSETNDYNPATDLLDYWVIYTD
nr:hypothetical protein [uncultured Acetatifactor sp.]